MAAHSASFKAGSLRRANKEKVDALYFLPLDEVASQVGQSACGSQYSELLLYYSLRALLLHSSSSSSKGVQE